MLLAVSICPLSPVTLLDYSIATRGHMSPIAISP